MFLSEKKIINSIFTGNKTGKNISRKDKRIKSTIERKPMKKINVYFVVILEFHLYWLSIVDNQLIFQYNKCGVYRSQNLDQWAQA